MSLAGRDNYLFCRKHEQCLTRLKVWQSNEFGVKEVTCLYSVSPQKSSVASGQKKWESVVLWLFSSGCEISVAACRLFDNVPATFWNLHVPSCTCSMELTSNSDVTTNCWKMADGDDKHSVYAKIKVWNDARGEFLVNKLSIAWLPQKMLVSASATERT